MMIGVALLAEGFHFEIPKGYIYFSMAFSLFVDVIQMRLHKKTAAPVTLREHYKEGEDKLSKEIV